MEEARRDPFEVLEQIPIEVIGIIFSFLPSRREITRLGVCCRHLFAALNLVFPQPVRTLEKIEGAFEFEREEHFILLIKPDGLGCGWKGKWIYEDTLFRGHQEHEQFGGWRVEDIQMDQDSGRKYIFIEMVCPNPSRYTRILPSLSHPMFPHLPSFKWIY